MSRSQGVTALTIRRPGLFSSKRPETYRPIESILDETGVYLKKRETDRELRRKMGSFSTFHRPPSVTLRSDLPSDHVSTVDRRGWRILPRTLTVPGDSPTTDGVYSRVRLSYCTHTRDPSLYLRLLSFFIPHTCIYQDVHKK